MPAHIVRLGSPRLAGEGTRIGSVRRPPRGVPKNEFASGNWYDVWFPLLAPSVETMKRAQAATDAAQWAAFERAFRRELAQTEASRALDLLAALSHTGSFSLGCYCDDEAHCHRRVLRAELAARGAAIAG